MDLRKGKGFGYISSEKKICMIRCFECGMENYAMAVSSGLCSNCGFDANAKKKNGPGKSKTVSKNSNKVSD